MAETDPTLQASLRSVAFHRLNGEKGEGVTLARQFQITAYPTFILVNDGGEVISRWIGFQGTTRFCGTIGAAKKDPTPFATRQARFAKKPTEADAAALAAVYEGQGDLKRAVEHYQRAITLAGASGGRYAPLAFADQVQGMSKNLFTSEELKATADQVLAWPGATQTDLMSVAFEMTNLALRDGRPELLAPYVESALAATAAAVEPPLAPYRQQLQIIEALHIRQDRPRALALKRATLPDGWEADARHLNEFASWCGQNSLNLEEAEKLSKKAITLAEAGRPRASCLDTLAGLQIQGGRPGEAVQSMEAALRELPGNKYLESQLSKYRAAQPAAGDASN